MPHQSFGTVRTAVEREPITFDFGLFGEETFTVMAEPSLGDILELHDAPEPTPQNEAESILVLARFITRMLPVEDRSRFAKSLYRIPHSEAVPILMGCATYIAEALTGFPSTPSPSSSGGRRRAGTSSRPKRAGATRSKSSQRGAPSR